MDPSESMVIERPASSELWTAELRYSLAVSAALATMAVLLRDPLLPFYSFTFVIGTAAVFFFAVTFGSILGLQQAASLMAIMFWANLLQSGDALALFMAEAPFLALFLVSLALVPNLRPHVLLEELRSYKGQIRRLDQKVAELQAVLRQEQKQNVEEKSIQARQLAAKISSRNTVLVAYARGVLQASSTREILNLLFYNLTKVFAAQQTAMLVVARDTGDLVISRIVHPDHARLENSRVAADLPFLNQVLTKKAPLASPAATPVTPDIEAEYLVPVVSGGEVTTIFTIAGAKDGPLTDEDRVFITTLASLTGAAVDQLTLATAM